MHMSFKSLITHALIASVAASFWMPLVAHAEVKQTPDIWEWTTGTDVVTFHAGAWDANGVASITIYVDGNVKRTCWYVHSYDSRECTTDLKLANYPAGTNLFVNAKAKDPKGNESWSTGIDLTATGPAAPAPTPENPAPTPETVKETPDAWDWADGTNPVTYHAGAWDPNGISSIAIYVNGTVKRTCWFTFSYDKRECATDLKTTASTAGTLFVNARAKDSRGNATWTEGFTIDVTATAPSGDSTNPTTPGTVKETPDVWEWTWNDVRSLTQTESTRYNVGAWDPNGISSIAVNVNGVQKRKCWYAFSYDKRECSIDLNGWTYAPGTTLNITSVASDSKGNKTTSEGITIKIQ